MKKGFPSQLAANKGRAQTGVSGEIPQIHAPARLSDLIREESVSSPYMTAQECTQEFRFSSVNALKQMARERKIPARKHGREWVFVRSEVEEWSIRKANLNPKASLSRFQEARLRILSSSLTTQSNAAIAHTGPRRGV